MSLYGVGRPGLTLKALLENPDLQNPQFLNQNFSDKNAKDSSSLFEINPTSAFLGPNLWNKTYTQDDLNLEFMDLDEFLSENGIPISPDTLDDISPVPTSTELGNSSNTTSLIEAMLRGDISNSPGPEIDIELPAEFLSPQLLQPNSPVVLLTPAVSPRATDESPVLSQSPESVLSSADIGSKNSQSPFVIKISQSPVVRENSQSQAVVRENVVPQYKNSPSRATRGSVVPAVVTQEQTSCKADCSESRVKQHEEICTAFIPGQDNFDPTNHKFSPDELKPQPLIKKSPKILVSDELKDDKYWNRRNKNNVAARRSRNAHRIKENQITMRAAYLEKENDEIKTQLEKLKKENKTLITRLAKYESNNVANE